METFSVSKIFELTGVDRRTLKKYLDKYPEDAMNGTRKEYTIRTVCKALTPLLGKESKGNEADPSEMQPKDRKDWYDAENKRLTYEAACRGLIPVDEVRTVVSEAFKIVVFTLDTLPDRVELEVGLQADQLKTFMSSIDDARQALSTNLERYLAGETPVEFEPLEDEEDD